MCLHLFRPFLRLSLAFLLHLSLRRGEHRELSSESSPFFIQSPPFSRIYSRVLPRASPGTPTLRHSLHFSSPSAVDNRSKRTSSIYSCTTSSDAGVPFPLPLSQSSVISHYHAPLASSSYLLRFLNSPSTRPIPPHTSIFSDRLIRKFPLSRVINPTFPPLIGDTFSRHDTKAHDSHNNSMPFLPFCHSNSTFVV